MSTRTDPDNRVTMICPNLNCRRTLSAPASARGKIMRCAYCNAPFRVPDNGTFDSEAAAAAREVKKR
ncbi:MAG: hypothetical protein ACE5I3_05085 [Phycisphaerae bacterium]